MIANDLVEPLMKMPPLKEYAIRLSDDPTKADLQQLASHIKLETTKYFRGLVLDLRICRMNYSCRFWSLLTLFFLILCTTSRNTILS